LLIIASSYTWDDNHIKHEHWPGGFKQDGEPVTSLDGIKTILSDHFTLEKAPFQLPLMLRKSSRIVEQRLTEVSIWRKNA